MWRNNNGIEVLQGSRPYGRTRGHRGKRGGNRKGGYNNNNYYNNYQDNFAYGNQGQNQNYYNQGNPQRGKFEEVEIEYTPKEVYEDLKKKGKGKVIVKEITADDGQVYRDDLMDDFHDGEGELYYDDLKDDDFGDDFDGGNYDDYSYNETGYDYGRMNNSQTTSTSSSTQRSQNLRQGRCRATRPPHGTILARGISSVPRNISSVCANSAISLL